MPQQQTSQNKSQGSKKFDGLAAASIIGFAIVMDILQGLGEWAIVGLITAGGSAATAWWTFGAGAAGSYAVGILIGATFGFFVATAAGVVLTLWFHFKRASFIGRLGIAAIIEVIPFLNMLPAWTLATVLSVLAANNSSLGKLFSGMVSRRLPSQAVQGSVRGGFGAAAQSPATPSTRGGFGRGGGEFDGKVEEEAEDRVGSDIQPSRMQQLNASYAPGTSDAVRRFGVPQGGGRTSGLNEPERARQREMYEQAPGVEGFEKPNYDLLEPGTQQMMRDRVQQMEDNARRMRDNPGLAEEILRHKNRLEEIERRMGAAPKDGREALEQEYSRTQEHYRDALRRGGFVK